MSNYIGDFSAYFDMQRLSMLPASSSALKVSFGIANRDNAVGAWRKRRKLCGGRGASTLKVACP